MSKKKFSGNTSAKKPAVNTGMEKNPVTVSEPVKKPVKPEIKVIETTEEGKTFIDEALEHYDRIIKEVDEYNRLKREDADKYYEEKTQEANDYLEKRRQEADAYYEKRKKDADGLEEKKQDEIDKEIARILKTKKEEAQQIVAEAQSEAEGIIAKAKTESEEIRSENIKRQEELNEKYEDYIKQFASLEARKLAYKQEINEKVIAEIEALKQEISKHIEEIGRLNVSICKKDKDIIALEGDNDYYIEQLKDAYIKQSELNEYKMRLENCQESYKKLETYNKELQDRLGALELQLNAYGDDPEKLIREITELKRQNEELRNIIADYPSPEELSNLRETSKKLEDLNNRFEIINQRRIELERENNVLKVSQEEIENYRCFIKILELQQASMRQELDRNIALYNTKTENVFACLSLIDSKTCNEYPNNPSLSLKMLCTQFRGYLANRQENPLYYDEITIRTFIAGFASSKLMILEGLSGTGKSSLPRAFAKYMGANAIEIPVQSSWKDRNDLLGFYNDFKKQYKETEFLKALYTAAHDSNNIYIIVLDEMNLSRIEYYFADLLSVLEKPDTEDWMLELISDYASVTQNKDVWPKLIHEGKLKISDNVWFVGTANKDDSTFTITDKVYDRSVIINFENKGEKDKKLSKYDPIQVNNDDFQKMLKNASNFKDDKTRERFDSIIKNLDKDIKEMFQITFGNRIYNQLETFVPVYMECGGTMEEAIDIIFSRKILRKLEGMYDDNTKSRLETLKDLITSYGYQMPKTKEIIEKMIDRI